MRALLAFLKTQNWQERGTDDGGEGVADIRGAVHCLISIFCTPLESGGGCMATIQDELEEKIIEYAKNTLLLVNKATRRFGTSFTHIQTSASGQTYFSSVSLSLVCLLLLVELRADIFKN